jgi:hypothetical protein
MIDPRRNLPAAPALLGGALLLGAVAWGLPVAAQSAGEPATREQVEALAARVATLEARLARLVALDSVRAALDAGRPLGPALAGLRDAPAALTRFATAAPPTEASLRLAFDETVRAARVANDPAREGQTMVDSALARVSGLLTVRRGEALVWGDAAALEIEAARRSLEAGDLEGSLAKLARLSAPAKEAMRPWTVQAEALVAARAALRGLAQ